MFATDATGTKVWEATYLPFGGVHTSTGTNSTLRFPGQRLQSESALHQNWMRGYDPTTGRYVQADPLGLVDGASVYGYVRQNPGRYSDPRGEDSLFSCLFFDKCDGAGLSGDTGGQCYAPESGGFQNDDTGILPTPPVVLPDNPDDTCENCVNSDKFPPGFWPADRGADEWGRRHGNGAQDGRRKFHREKQDHPGSGADEDFGVNPETGEIVDGNGESAGDLNDAD